METVTAEHVPVVAGVDDEGPGCFGIDCRQHPTDLGVAKTVARKMVRVAQVGLASAASQLGLMGLGMLGPFFWERGLSESGSSALGTGKRNSSNALA